MNHHESFDCSFYCLVVLVDVNFDVTFIIDDQEFDMMSITLELML